MEAVNQEVDIFNNNQQKGMLLKNCNFSNRIWIYKISKLKEKINKLFILLK